MRLWGRVLKIIAFINVNPFYRGYDGDNLKIEYEF